VTSTFDLSLYEQRAARLTRAELAKTHEHASRWYAEFLRPWLPPDLQTPMLDLPCGTGNLLYALQALGYQRVDGVDSDEEQVNLARALGLNARKGDAFEVLAETTPGSVGRIFALDFIEHLEKEQAFRFCKLACAALRPGGMILCRTPSADGPFGAADRYNDVTHKWALTSTASHPFLALAGFSKIEVIDEAPVPYKLANKIRRLLFRATTRSLGAYLHLVGIGAPAIWTRSMWIIGEK
jgi:2-polyprenyl-3-methyl-5-hydroxy-6-metoxy-1,4-benzoquinol methylase